MLLAARELCLGAVPWRTWAATLTSMSTAALVMESLALSKMQRVWVCALLSLLTATAAMGAKLEPPQHINSQTDASRFLETYYMQPRPELIPRAFAVMSQGTLLKNASARGPLIVFLGTTMRKNPEVIGAMLALAGKLPMEQAGVIYSGLWFVNTDAMRETLQRVMQDAQQADVREGIAALLERQPPDLNDMAIDSPAIVDMLWAWYMASGNPKALQRIIAILPWTMDSNQVNRYVTGTAAKATLIANCKQHPAVLRYCELSFEEQSSDTQRVLQIVLEQVKSP